MILTRALLALTSLLVVTVGCGRGRGGGGAADDDDDAGGGLVVGLAIDGVALYQGVRIDLLRDGDEVLDESAAPVVSGRPAMLRVFVNPGSDWERRAVLARVELSVGGEAERVSAESEISGASSEDSLGNTINVEVPAELMTGDTAIVSVELHEAESGVVAEGNSAGATWEPNEPLDLGARDPGPPVRIVLVPVRYNGDGSGRLPDTSATQIARYRDGLFAQYPARDVEIEVRSPMDVNRVISPFGAGWGETLEQLYYLRDSANAGFEEYWYAVFVPASSFAEYCPQGCVAGLSSLASSPNDSWARVSIGVGYSGDGAVDTMVHEVGHAHGREHAPCDVDDAGPFPHPGAGLGVQGYDLVTGQLKSTSTYTDFMGYCDPTWVSDFTFDALFTRIAAVNANAAIVTAPGFRSRWAAVVVDGRGKAFRGTTMSVDLPPSGKPTAVELLGADGAILRLADGSFHPYSHGGGGRVMFPEPGSDVQAVRIVGGPTIPW